LFVFSYNTLKDKQEIVMKIWLLTKEYGDYDQYGENFEAAFANKPTHAQLMAKSLTDKEATFLLAASDGKGKMAEWESYWYNLREVELE